MERQHDRLWSNENRLSHLATLLGASPGPEIRVDVLVPRMIVQSEDVLGVGRATLA